MPSAQQIKDRKAIADHVCDHMHRHHRDTSIDALLCRPVDALVMGLSVALKAGRLPKARAVPLLKQLAAMQRDQVEALEVAGEICRAALSSRKRGDVRKDRY